MSMELSPGLVLRPGTRLFEVLNRLSRDKKMLFVCGLPGVGKSLLLQQTALLAERHGRSVHLLRWDVARLGFEQAPAAAAYPQVGGVTHAAIRLAIGHWVRTAVADWHASTSEDDLLLAECPMVGNRFVELARQQTDSLEALLASDSVRFLIPTPSLEVRGEIESIRAQEMVNPRHAQEVHNAPPNVLHALMDEIHALARRFGLASGDARQGYSPESYLGVYGEVLRHRPQNPLLIEEVLPVRRSAQATPNSCIELVPSAAEVAESIALVQDLSDEQMQRMVSEWWKV